MNKYGPTMQCNNKILYEMFKVSASGPNLSSQPKAPLISRLINVCWMPDQLLIRHRLNSLTSWTGSSQTYSYSTAKNL